MKVKLKHLNNEERLFYVLRTLCFIIVFIPTKIGNWATFKLNNSCFRNYPSFMQDIKMVDKELLEKTGYLIERAE